MLKNANMVNFDECEEKIGHAPGGVCSFEINDEINVYLDESLESFAVFRHVIVVTQLYKLI